ncbi:NAD-dependent epimerase/dehydratase family protein [Marinicrinis lubricantis]|uniref:NAD-dependent epimerase/dehydratase family protein n=1 Tax=Marinicrinis lubricantis TaxID=2086470 RepID=A0ABW1IL31_9BACL
MNILVTGCAGFIGSHLCERLLREGHTVYGLDALVPSSTPQHIRERNLNGVLNHPRFQWIQQDVLTVDWSQLLTKVDIVYHLAGMPGVRSSWGKDFKPYVTHNIEATQQLLEGCRRYPVKRFIYASTSSVYGEKTGRVDETALTEPLSPYGITKLTGEHLCRVYAAAYDIPAVVLRFFTVYGPRQRPDMAFNRFIHHMAQQTPIPVFGDGTQSRDFTYIDDCIDAVAAATHADGIIGETINIGGKERATVLECISILEEIFGIQAVLQFTGNTRGEPKHTWADISKARALLNYEPKVTLQEGLRMEVRDLLPDFPID